MDNGFEMHLFCCDQGEALPKIKPHLVTKEAQCACAGAISTAFAVGEEVL